jgi:hypothetical protein
MQLLAAARKTNDTELDSRCAVLQHLQELQQCAVVRMWHALLLWWLLRV